MLFALTLVAAVIKGIIILSLITSLVSKIRPQRLAGWMIKGILHPASVFVITMAICALISLFSGESAEAGVANLTSSIILSGTFPLYAKRKYAPLLSLTVVPAK